MKFRYGIWGLGSEESTSNYRELRNLVESRDLDGREIFLFTDNSTAEAIAHKGSSSSKLLFDLVILLYKFPMKYLCSLNLFHVSGTRMIAQGSDGLSRGDILEGSLNGHSMLSFVPLHLSALEREISLRGWMESWLTKHAEGGNYISRS